jgi:diguanylate cyclase (GGDEF)-like protein
MLSSSPPVSAGLPLNSPSFVNPSALLAAALLLALLAGCGLADFLLHGPGANGVVVAAFAALIGAVWLASLAAGVPQVPQASSSGEPAPGRPQPPEKGLTAMLQVTGLLYDAEAARLFQAGGDKLRRLAEWGRRGGAEPVTPLPPGPLTFVLETLKPYASREPGETRLGYSAKLPGHFLAVPLELGGVKYLLVYERKTPFNPAETGHANRLEPLFTALMSGGQQASAAAHSARRLRLAVTLGSRLAEAQTFSDWVAVVEKALEREWPEVEFWLALKSGELYAADTVFQFDPEREDNWVAWGLRNAEHLLAFHQPTGALPLLPAEAAAGGAPFQMGQLLPLTLGSTRGLLAARWPSPPPPDADELLEIIAPLLEETANRLRAHSAAARAADTDPLTGLLNRRGFQSGYEELPPRGRIALLAIDLDHFKKINDSHGHAAGDTVLKKVAVIIREELRGGDLGGRMGGEELALLLPAAEPAGARRVAERLRSRLAAERFDAPAGSFQVTMSIGLVATSGPRPILAALLERADKALYRAKAEGRNRVVEAAEVES